MKDFLKETGLAISIILAVILVIWITAVLRSGFKAESECYKQGYLKAVSTYDLVQYCQTRTESIPLSEVIGNDR